MALNAQRAERVKELSGAAAHPISLDGITDQRLTRERYGELSFGEKNLRKCLPKAVYKSLKRSLDLGQSVDPAIADVIANAMKNWAESLGATHYTHWFQPITIAHQAEKHDAFLEIFPGQESPMFEFSGNELIRGEPDGSSFPSGGLRETHQARGYTFWDPTSPAFIRLGPNGGNTTLCIPTAFCSWTGEALDHKTPLLRSTEVLSEQCVKLLRLAGDDETNNVYTTLGIEQEFFVIDRSFALQRPDILLSGRSLLGAAPSKGQEMDDHYFGAMPVRVAAAIQEVEAECWKLGMPAKTRHNEVAPSQYEMAPIFEKAAVASDHNLVQMEILERVCRKHDLHCLLHEKPFKGVNGSGKHNNWSLSTNLGDNLLDPGNTPADNARFLLFLTVVLKAIDDHQDILRASMANAGQEHRLGANEAPPAIITAYLGEELDQVVRELIAPEQAKGQRRDSKMVIGVNSMPPLRRDRTDRNRTSPFAFTGNKFEFRAVGSSQHVALPNVVLNTITADAARKVREEIESQMREKQFNFKVARQMVIQATLNKHYRIVNNGNGYDKNWPAEAEKRGLLNLRTTPSALDALVYQKNLDLFSELKVLSNSEMKARHSILMEQYALQINIESNLTAELAQTHVLPSLLKYQTSLATAVSAVAAAGGKASAHQKKALDKATDLLDQLYVVLEAHHTAHHGQEAAEEKGPGEHAYYCNTTVIPAMSAIREVCDEAEVLISDADWSLPKYREILYLK